MLSDSEALKRFPLVSDEHAMLISRYLRLRLMCDLFSLHVVVYCHVNQRLSVHVINHIIAVFISTSHLGESTRRFFFIY